MCPANNYKRYSSISLYCCCSVCFFFLAFLYPFFSKESSYMYLDDRFICFIPKQLWIFRNFISSITENLFRDYAFRFVKCFCSFLLLPLPIIFWISPVEDIMMSNIS